MKLLKRITAALCAASLITISIISCFADTHYFENGYFYSFRNNNEVSLVGWDYRTSVLPVPSVLNNRAVTLIGNNAFMDDENLTGVDFSNATNLHSIGVYSFAGCVNISEKLTLPESLYFIDDCAFEGCTSIPELEINSDLYYIPVQCFNNCTSLETVKLNDNLEQILNYAFANCPLLTRVDIPDSVTFIADTAFQNDNDLILGVNYGSYAYQYAVDKGIRYVLLDQEIILGDVDKSCFVDIRDVTEIQKHLAELGDPLDELALYAADVNGDGNVDISDATSIQLFLAELDFTYPIGQIIS